MPQDTPQTIVRQGTDGWVPNADSFGARLALIRQYKGWGNVAEAARACSLPIETWRYWEANNTTPRDVVTVAKQIAEATGCSYLWLLLGDQAAESGVPA